ncbi:MAG: hypothetical protein AB7V42_09390 [Thermoleophilia bacterium]
MRRLLVVAGVASLIAAPAVALADDPEQAVETDPTAEAVAGPTTDKALHADGRGSFRYEGSGATVVSGGGLVRVVDLSQGKDLVVTPAGYGRTAKGANGDGAPVGRYAGRGTVTVDGSSYRITALGKFTADVDPSALHPATGSARVAGSGETILKGGVPVPFWAAQRIQLTRGPLTVDLSGSGGPRWWNSKPRGVRGVKTVTTTRTVVTRRGTQTHTRTTTTRLIRRWWGWDSRAPGATWRLNGPAAGTVQLSTLTGRIRVWDRSAGKDLAVVVPAGTTTRTLADGSVLYSRLRGAPVSVTGSAFRMKVRAYQVKGTFTPAPGSLARGFVRGKGTYATADGSVTPGRVGGVRVLLQPGS